MSPTGLFTLFSGDISFMQLFVEHQTAELYLQLSHPLLTEAYMEYIMYKEYLNHCCCL